MGVAGSSQSLGMPQSGPEGARSSSYGLENVELYSIRAWRVTSRESFHGQKGLEDEWR